MLIDSLRFHPYAQGMRLLTRSEAETKRRKAVEFLKRIGNDDAAERFDAMTPEDYAEHKGVELIENPLRRKIAMAETGPTKAELSETLDQIEDLLEDALDPELTREELVAKVKEIADVASGDDGGDDEEEEPEPGE
jgi:hypothetical protein